jgi:hypothetical protein
VARSGSNCSGLSNAIPHAVADSKIAPERPGHCDGFAQRLLRKDRVQQSIAAI